MNSISKKSQKKDRVSIVQGGYVSQSATKSLSVSKKPNILDKIPPKGPKGAISTSINASNNNNSSSAVVSGVTERDLRDFTDEIRKLKAIIVKHENRIRALEAAAIKSDDVVDTTKKEAPSTVGGGGDGKSTDKESDNSTNLAPDEV